MKVLYVEDSPSDADLTQRALGRAAPGVELEIVGTVAAALARLDDLEAAIARDETPPFNLILLDMNLPDGNGLSVLAEVRHRSLPLAVVVLTGSGDEESVLAALRAGANDYLPKNSDYWTHLHTTLRSALVSFRSLAARDSRPLRLLYVESNEQDVHLTRLHLAAHAPFIRLQAVHTAEQALERLPKAGPVADVDVVLIDYRLPGMNAIEALKEISHVRGLDVPVVLTTGHGTEEIALQALKLGAADYLLKSPGYLYRLPSALENVFYRAQVVREHAALRESERRFSDMLGNLELVAFMLDRDARITYCNDYLLRLTGWRREEVIGRDWFELFVPPELDNLKDVFAALLANLPSAWHHENEILIRSGGRRLIQWNNTVLRAASGEVIGTASIGEDVTERKKQDQKIARLSRIQEVLSGINSAIVRIRDRQELFKEACRIAVEHGRFSLGWIAMLDQASGKLVPVAQAGLPLDLGAGVDSSNRPVGLAPGGTAEVALRERRPAFDNNIEGKPGSLNSEIGPDTLSVRRAAIRLGAKSVIVLPLYVEGKTFGILTLYAPERNFFDDEELKLLTELAGDISFGLEFIAKEEKVDYLAYYDALTGLPNRSLFFDRLTHQLGTATRERLNVALVLMDIDRFRLINDTLGRQAGDALIAAVAKRINTTVRDQDTVARVGADSFAVAVSGTWGATDAARVLESHNRQLFGQPFVLGGEELRVAATTGVAMFPGDGDNPEVLFANAEAALKKAKSSGERFLFYGPEMNASVADALRLENRLRQALENGEMVLWYQPKVSVKTRKLTGLEALMRWQDPETGMVPPARFIPLMEQTGLILDAGKWAMSQVARDCTLWAKDGFKPARVAVNVSPIELRQKDFVATVVEAAQKTEEAGSMLDLEITESVIMENVEAIIPILQTVRGRGVEIAVDDFGTGYSSLAYIARLPINDLKIDRSFVNGMTQSQDSLTIVRSVISLAHSLRLNVVAEGVETEEQAALLLELGCDEMQGYLISRPVPPDKVPELLSRQKIAAIRPARRRSRKSPVR